MVPIPKKGKDKTDPNSYRPISLLSCTSKLMERIVNTRLVWHLEKKWLLIPQQAGFRKHMSTEDQVAHIAQEIEDAFQEGQHTLAVWVDMEKAFDKVWHDGLRLKMLKAGVGGKMFHWISHLLANRQLASSCKATPVATRESSTESHKMVYYSLPCFLSTSTM